MWFGNSVIHVQLSPNFVAKFIKQHKLNFNRTSHGNANWRQTLLMCAVQSLLQDDQRSQNAYASAWWKEASQLQPVRLLKHHFYPSEKPHAGGVKPFICNQCNYSFTTAGNLKTHSGERPFSCTQCNNTFTQAGNLKTHILTHSGERPFRCEQCNYTCIRANDFKKHILKHTEEKKHLYVSSAATLAVSPVVWSITHQFETFCL